MCSYDVWSTALQFAHITPLLVQLVLWLVFWQLLQWLWWLFPPAWLSLLLLLWVWEAGNMIMVNCFFLCQVWSKQKSYFFFFILVKWVEDIFFLLGGKFWQIWNSRSAGAQKRNVILGLGVRNSKTLYYFLAWKCKIHRTSTKHYFLKFQSVWWHRQT